MTSLLITGGTGSLGRALLTALLARTSHPAHAVTRLVCFSRDEFKQAMMREEPWGRDPRLRYFIGDVRDYERLRRAFVGVDTVVHAAALKWIGEGIYNPDEIVKTNVVGTMRVLEAAADAGVGRVLVITSDKGVHPANVYGASKYLAEQYAVQANAFTFPRGCRVACVRYGNVLWSRGSVAYRFKAQAPPYRITDARMSRFGIRLSEAVSFVLSSLDLMRGGEVFIPRLPSFRIVDVAGAVYHAAYRAQDRTPLEIVGHRQGGEKVHEMLLSEEESTHTVWIGDRWVVEPEIRSWDRPAWEGEPVPEGWSYTSEKNHQWLSEADLMATFEEMERGLASV